MTSREIAATPFLAFTRSILYFAVMRTVFVRRILAIVLSMALATGLVLHSACVGDTGMNSSAAMSSDMPMPGGCDGCGDDGKGAAPGLCAAYCSTVVNLTTTSITLVAVPIAVLTCPADLQPAGRGEPPDPYPPRLVVLS